MTCNDLSIVTYNLHGYNQGLSYLCELLSHNDIICVQEHWLSSSDSNKLLDINGDFLVVAFYALDDALGRGVLRGRPFGGLAIFIKSSLINKLNIICRTDRLIIVQLNNLLIGNIYMPCADDELFTSILGNISDHIHDSVAASNIEHYIIAGDFNYSCVLHNSLTDVFNDFISSCNLCHTVHCDLNTPMVTYMHSSLNHKSMIDYILVSTSLYKYVSSAGIHDSGLNLSDHIPVVMWLRGLSMVGYDIRKVDDNHGDCFERKSIRWDKADLAMYYTATGVNLSPIFR